VNEGVQDRCVTNNLDTLATALLLRVDDLLKAAPHLVPWRPRVGIAPKLSDAELVTLAVMQSLPGFISEAHRAADRPPAVAITLVGATKPKRVKRTPKP
jgi:hypothetical protein